MSRIESNACAVMVKSPETTMRTVRAKQPAKGPLRRSALAEWDGRKPASGHEGRWRHRKNEPSHTWRHRRWDVPHEPIAPAAGEFCRFAAESPARSSRRANPSFDNANLLSWRLVFSIEPRRRGQLTDPF